MALYELIASVASGRGWELIALEIMPDHVHCFIGAPPRESVAQIVRQLKGSSRRELRKRFRHLRSLPVLWSPSYFAGSAGNVSSDTIEGSIAEQRTR
jgi:putative transposase